ncbi:sel1 repeat family protein [Rhodoferax sp. 4810]|nr:sel1 repeat family protein [Rhodoferax jenense]
MNRLLLSMLLLVAGAASAQTGEKTIRICDDTGCSDRPRSSATFDPSHDDNPEQTRRLAALADVAQKDPRAAYDLALRYFRGDGVPRDSYLAIKWMREAGDRGVPQAYLALGRFYLMGVEEMGADPAEAENWLSLAAARGDKEAKKLLAEARTAKKTEQELYQWRETYRKNWYGWWSSGYAYHWYWGPAGWYYR